MIRFINLAHPRIEILTVPCLRTLNILAHAQMEELDIGSLCGGHGLCGGDRVLIAPGTTGLSALTQKERNHLTPEEILMGWRLGCQCWPENDDLDISVLIPTSC